MKSALIIRKATKLEQHQDLQKQSLVVATDPQYLASVTKAHHEHYSCLETLRQSLTRLGVKFQEASLGEDWSKAKFDLVITLGGDGTLIAGSYGIHDETPLIGIRSSSASVGFLCAADQSNTDRVVEDFFADRLDFVERQRLQASIKRASGKIEQIKTVVLNDFLFAAVSPAATTRYRVGFLDRIEAHRSSGIWISTATGSTAAIGAAGGTAMEARDQHLQFKVRELYHRREENLLITHGFAMPGKDIFWIESHCPRALLALDGDKQIIKINFGDVISFLPAHPVRVGLRPL